MHWGLRGWLWRWEVCFVLRGTRLRYRAVKRYSVGCPEKVTAHETVSTTTTSKQTDDYYGMHSSYKKPDAAQVIFVVDLNLTLARR